MKVFKVLHLMLFLFVLSCLLSSDLRAATLENSEKMHLHFLSKDSLWNLPIIFLPTKKETPFVSTSRASPYYDEWSVSFDLPSLFNPYKRYIKLGGEYRLNNQIGIASEFGVKFDGLKFIDLDQQEQNLKRFQLRVDGRYYLKMKRDKRMYSFYLGPEFRFSPEWFERYQDHLTSSNNAKIYYDFAKIRRANIELGIRAGKKFYLTDNIRLELFVSLGWQHSSIKHLELSNPSFDSKQTNLSLPALNNFNAILNILGISDSFQTSRKEGHSSRSYISFGVKVVYGIVQVM